jgi:MinD superfamily P-loop ATPase
LGQTIHSLVDLDVDKPIVHFWHEIVVVDDLLRNKFYRDAHVFRSFEWCVEVKVFNVRRHEFGSWFGDNAVEEKCDGCEACQFHGNFAGIIDSIATNCDLALVRFFFLRADVGAEACVGYCASCGDL